MPNTLQKQIHQPPRRASNPKKGVSPSRHLSANMAQLGPPLLQLSAHLTHLGRTLARIFREILTQTSPKTSQATERPPKPRFWTIFGPSRPLFSLILMLVRSQTLPSFRLNNKVAGKVCKLEPSRTKVTLGTNIYKLLEKII